MTTPIISPWPSFSGEEGDLVREVLLSNKVNYWTGGIGREFEREFAEMCSTTHAIALANGTLALDLALKALKIGPGDEVIGTPRSFMASASAVHNSGAKPVFADIHHESQNITAESIDAVITDRTRAVVCVHLAGWPCDMEAIKQLAEEKNIYVIEDCAQAHGARIKGQSVGSFGDIGAWSFCQDKVMTTGGEGGMVTTSNDELYNFMWSYKDHGKNRTKMESPASNKGFKFVHDSFGTNFRLTEMQSVLGSYQLGLLSDWTKERTQNAMFYHNGLVDIDAVRSPLPPEDVEHAFYKYYLFLNLDQLASGWSRSRVVNQVNERGGQVFTGSCPEIYKEHAFVDAYGDHNSLPNAVKVGQESLMLACHPGLSTEFLDHNLSLLKDVLAEALK